MTVRLFSSTSVETTLASGISSTATSMTVAAGTGSSLTNGVTIAAGTQFTVAIDPDTTSEEIVFITAQSTDTFTITRGRAGSSQIAHSAGATVQHVKKFPREINLSHEENEKREAAFLFNGKIRVGIDGFSRDASRALLARTLLSENVLFEITAIEDPNPPATLAHFFKYFSPYWRTPGKVRHTAFSLNIDGVPINLLNKRSYHSMSLPQ